MNYYKLLIDELEDSVNTQFELLDINILNGSLNTKYQILGDNDETYNQDIKLNIKANRICMKFINIRFSNNLKQYNNDVEKAYDLFSAKKTMDYLNIYVEEIFFLDKEETGDNQYIRNELRNLVNMLWYVINNNK